VESSNWWRCVDGCVEGPATSSSLQRRVARVVASSGGEWRQRALSGVEWRRVASSGVEWRRVASSDQPSLCRSVDRPCDQPSNQPVKQPLSDRPIVCQPISRAGSD
jgi:hypothetical protein